MCASPSINPYDVNRCDPTEMLRCRSELYPRLQRLAEATDYRILRFPQRFDRDGQHYAENANILLLSGFVGKPWYFKCGLLKHTCGNWKVCPACCHRKRMTILNKFLPVFHNCEGQLGFITLSSKRPHFCGDRFCDNLEQIWDAYRFGFEIMTDLGEFDAVFLLEELQVLSYWPVPKVLAHVHAVVLADEISMRKTERLKGFVENYPGYVKVPQKWIVKKELRNRIADRLFDRRLRWMLLHDCDGIPFDLSTRTYKIQTETDCAGVLGYLAKPIDWSERYLEEWQLYCAEDRDIGNFFNQNVDQVIDCWQFFSSGRDQHVYLGTAHHARTGFIGIPKGQRETNRHKLRTLAILEDCNMDRMFASPDDLGETLEHRDDGSGESATAPTTTQNGIVAGPQSLVG